MSFSAQLAQGLARALTRIETRINRDLAEAVDEGEREMVARAPVDSGELQRSITRESAGGVERIRVTAAHAIPVEFGTVRTPPRPFFRPGVAVIEQRARRAGR